ncbi:MAG: hypothetical protein ACJZ8X_04690 [Candidatus Puniceispirillales bacterium]
MKKIKLKIFEDRIKFWTEKAKKSAAKPLADKVLGFISMAESIVFSYTSRPLFSWVNFSSTS